MKAHVVLAHPEPNSFNGRLARESRETLTRQGFEVSFSDLYGMGFDPCEGPRHYSLRADPAHFDTPAEQRRAAEHGLTPPEVAAEIARLRAAELLVVHFPLWWFGPPAMLKGWIDRVFVYGPVYRSTMRYDRGVFRGKRMIACVTTGAPAAACGHSGQEGETRLVLWPLLYAFRYVGFTVLEPALLHGIGDIPAGAYDRLVSRWREALGSLSGRAAIAYNRDTDFDDAMRLKPGAPVHAPFTRHRATPSWE